MWAVVETAIMLLKVTRVFHTVSLRGQEGYRKLHVESLGGSLLLPVQHILLRLLEVFLGDLHERKRLKTVERESESPPSSFSL